MHVFLQLFVVVLICAAPSVSYSETGFFRDDFAGTSLKPELRINAEDEDRWTLVDNDYLMIIPKERAGGITNYISYAGDLVENYNFSVKATSLPSHREFVIDISLWQDDDNWLSLQYVILGSTYVRYFKSLRGEISSYEYRDGVLGDINDLSLSIQKKGVEYHAYFSVDGSNWIELGNHAFLNFEGTPGFGSYNRKNAPEAPVRFDYVEIRPID